MRHTEHSPTATRRVAAKRSVGRDALVLAGALVALLVFAPSAGAKQAVDFFGGAGTLGGQFEAPRGVAVNDSGAGAGEAGDVYALDSKHLRIQRFHRDDNGTPAFTADDTYAFVSAWGVGVESGGGDYEVCTVATDCGPASAGSGNGALGASSTLGGIAVDQDTGYVYVADSGNNRVNVYAGDGAFLYSFGYDVVASGPGDVAGPDETQTVTVNADIGKFSLAFRGETTGASTDSTTNSAALTNGSKLLIGFTGKLFPPASGAWEVGQGISTAGSSNNHYFPSGTTITAIDENAGTLTASQPASFSSITGGTFVGGVFGHDLPHDATAQQVEDALNGLPTIGGAGGSVSVSGPAGGPYQVDFGGSLAGTDVPPLVAYDGNLGLGAGFGSAAVAETAKGGAYEICSPADGDVCRGGSSGDGAAGEIGRADEGIAVSAPDGEPDTGTVFLADRGSSFTKQRIDTYDLDGQNPASLGSSAELFERTRGLAVDSRGILYIVSGENGILRYDTEDANGEGVGFLDRIPKGVNERQQVAIDASAGQFRLCFDGDCSGDLPFDANNGEVTAALVALPSVGGANVSVGSGGGPKTISRPIPVAFSGALLALDVPELTCANGTVPLSGGAGCSVATTTPGQPGASPNATRLAVDPSTDTLYAAEESAGVIQQFGPAEAPGLSTPPASDEERHNTNRILGGRVAGMALEPASERIYATADAAGEAGRGVYVLDETSPTPPTATLDSLTDVSAHSFTAQATIDPNGPPASYYRFEYVDDATYQVDGFASAESTPEALLGVQEDPQAVEATISPGAVGLEPNTTYHVRVVARRKFADPVISAELSTTTDPEAPIAETVASPIRTTTTAELQGRVGANNAPTDYRFEYGSQGPCDANPCASTPTEALAGADSEVHLVAAPVEGLEPDTTYHYRLVADNGAPGSPSAGGDRTIATRAAGRLSHGDFPGPPNSDRAWEQVSLADSSGNPAGEAYGISDDGNRVAYTIFGGTPIGNTGSVGSPYFAERTAGGWRTQALSVPREQQAGVFWADLFGRDDLRSFTLRNAETGPGATGAALWRFAPGGPAPREQFRTAPGQKVSNHGGPEGAFGVSADGSRTLAWLTGPGLDPAFPAAGAKENVYDVSAGGQPRLVSLLPGDVVAACGTETDFGAFFSKGVQASGWLSAEGSRAFFPSSGDECSGPTQLYLREIDAGVTKLVSGPPISGPDCGAGFIRASAGAAFFWTQSRLDSEDDAISFGGCAGGAAGSGPPGADVYRYEIAGGELDCLTCGLGAEAGVEGEGAEAVAVSEDGSRVYFTSSHRLLPGAPPEGERGVYRLEVASGELAFVSPASSSIGYLALAATLSSDGSKLLFGSDAPIDPIGGSADNQGTFQYYLYDDETRALDCVTCPHNGEDPQDGLLSEHTLIPQDVVRAQPNVTPLADDGTFAFVSNVALVPADQNTPAAGEDPDKGDDVYEWRDGRHLLVSDGIASRAGPQMSVEGVSPSGRDVFFRAAAQYTPDAPDANRRLYDARIGGGIEFPPPPEPCPLEVCQGTPRGAPPKASWGSRGLLGRGNPAAAPRDCAAPTRRARRQARTARRQARRAKRMWALAKRGSDPRRARIARRRAKRFGAMAKRRAAVAKRNAARAKRCRIDNRRTSR